MHILASRWAEDYMKLNPEISIYVEGGGTAQGVQALVEGKADICTASRPLRPNEARLLAENYGKLGMNFLVAKDALSIYIHPQNPVQDLTLAQVKEIFGGKITNWQDVGGHNAPITVLIRPPNSGTHLYFKEHVLDGDDYTPTAQIMSTTSMVVNVVTDNPEAIGYGGIAYGMNVVHCQLDGFAPTEENIRNDRYPIIRYLYLYTIDTPPTPVKAFIDWILSEGQKVVNEVGYMPLWTVD